MMRDRCDITVYAPECDPIPGVTTVNCLPDSDRQSIFGKDDENRLPAWPTDQQSARFNIAASREVRERAEPHDIIFFSGGLTHKPIRDALPEFLCVEGFVGYVGVFGGNVHAAYESYSHMAQVAQKYEYDIRWFDRVIPPFCDPDEFPVINDGKGDYLLFVGRLIERKGPHIALQIAEAAGLPLHVAGAGDIALVGSKPDTVVYHGPVGIEERAKLMAGARALICPTTYCEPGGNIAIEAQMAGTPVIAPDWGVFSETVQHGTTGYHFRTLKQAVDAVKCVQSTLEPETIRFWAQRNYSLSAIGLKFDAWFDDLSTLWGSGWNTL